MANILTADQAANALRVPNTDPRIADLLPQVDKFIERATGRDWTQDAQKNPIATLAATITIVIAYDNPAMLLPEGNAPFGLVASLAQLEAEALRYRTYQFRGISSPGHVAIPGARVGDQVISLSGVWGVTGDQSSKFESTVNNQGSLEQISGDNLSQNMFVVILKNPADDISP